MEFWETYYSANLMTLGICSDETIEELEVWIREKFDKVVNKNLVSPNEAIEMPYGKNELGKMFYVVPVKNTDYLFLTFYLDYLLPKYKSNPLAYIDYLLDNKCKNQCFHTSQIVIFPAKFEPFKIYQWFF